MSSAYRTVLMPQHNGCMTGREDGVAGRLARAGVTGREAEVLSAVAERLRNREIAARLHVSVRTVESHVAALLRKLGVTDRAALAEMGAQLRRTTAADTTLPVPLTSLVGRESETSQLTALVHAHRLVTLTGPAGVGKTRLALRIAAVQAGPFPDGARLADLAPVAPDMVSDTIARALGVVPQRGWSLRDILREVAGEMRCLLVVDNCEHVVAEAAEIVAGLLTAGGQLRVLATSREPLGVPGEVSYQVQPLPVPAQRDSSRAAAAGELRCGAPFRRTCVGRVARLHAYRHARPGGGGAVRAARRTAAGDRAGRRAGAQLRAG
jgi:DNA-binding CsgD family transcriptional regulator